MDHRISEGQNLGPHAPHLTPKEIDLLHKVWLDFSEKLPNEELHHHNVVHFALDMLTRAMQKGDESEVVRELQSHLQAIESRRYSPDQTPNMPKITIASAEL